MLRVLCIVTVVVVVESSCHKHKVAAPLPPLPRLQPAARVPSQKPFEPPPYIPPAPTPAPPKLAIPVDLYQVNRPPEPKKSRTATAAPATPQPAPAPPAPAPPPRLGDILTQDQQREYNAAIDQSLSRAQASLGSIGNRQLTRDQQSLVEQIHSFMQQAQDTRKTDLEGAKRLAERADVLAGDLVASFR
ncbi:MAG TPA: hypothetical protein VMB25_18255 [Bryobacteraceae bacterium]|nr:hypothetical protein [Bryobacteraceae bacterium]